MPINNNDILRIAVRQKDVNNSDVVNVYMCHVNAAAEVDNATALADIAAFFDDAYSNLNALINQYLDPLDIKVDVIQIIGGVVRIVENIGTTSWGSLYSPAGSGDTLPAGCAALVLLRTLVGKVFGRKFIPGVNEGNSTNGFINSTLLGALGTFASALLDGLVAVDWGANLGILSTRTGQFESFVGYDVSDNIAYQRRRRPGRGS